MMVLPRPISSARMPLRRRVYMVVSQSRPTCWYSRSAPFSRKGTCARTGPTQLEACRVAAGFCCPIMQVLNSKELPGFWSRCILLRMPLTNPAGRLPGMSRKKQHRCVSCWATARVAVDIKGEGCAHLGADFGAVQGVPLGLRLRGQLGDALQPRLALRLPLQCRQLSVLSSGRPWRRIRRLKCARGGSCPTLLGGSAGLGAGRGSIRTRLGCRLTLGLICRTMPGLSALNFQHHRDDGLGSVVMPILAHDMCTCTGTCLHGRWTVLSCCFHSRGAHVLLCGGCLLIRSRLSLL